MQKIKAWRFGAFLEYNWSDSFRLYITNKLPIEQSKNDLGITIWLVDSLTFWLGELLYDILSIYQRVEAVQMSRRIFIHKKTSKTVTRIEWF